MMATFWKYRDLLWQFTLRNVEMRHKGSHLGLAWSFLNPLLILSLYYFVFGYIFGGRFGESPEETRVDYALGLFLGLTLFHVIAEIMTTAPVLIISNPNFVKKVVFPLEILPVAQVGAALFHMLISLALVLTGIAILGPGLSVSVLWLPLIVVPMIFILFGLAWLLSGLGVFLRDISQMMQFLSMALLYASAVFYPATKITAPWTFLRYNPLLVAVELTRDTVLWHKPLAWLPLLYLYAFGLAACYLGYLAFRRMKPAFADVL